MTSTGVAAQALVDVDAERASAPVAQGPHLPLPESSQAPAYANASVASVASEGSWEHAMPSLDYVFDPAPTTARGFRTTDTLCIARPFNAIAGELPDSHDVSADNRLLVTASLAFTTFKPYRLVEYDIEQDEEEEL